MARLAAAIAWVLITEDLIDKPFLDKYCIGYDETTLPASAPRNAHYKAYILGQGDDGIAKTPQWAAQITSIPAEKIIQLAREIGSAKPAYICQGWGPQRHSNGEQTARAIAMLSVLTGNVGINGGNSGVREGTWDLGVEWFSMLEEPGKNPDFGLYLDRRYRSWRGNDRHTRRRAGKRQARRADQIFVVLRQLIR